MIEFLIGGIVFYALFRIFYYFLKIKTDDPYGYFTFTTAGNDTITMNNNSLFTFDGTTNYWDNQSTTGSTTFEFT